MSKHTQGNWRVIRKGSPIGYANYEVAYTDDGELICDVIYEEADARLIAAAPELLEALEDIVFNGIGTEAIRRSRAAIAKAKGEK